MKKKKFNSRIINYLHGFFILCFVGAALSLLSMIIVELKISNLKFKYISIHAPNLNGYAIPVIMNISKLPDSIVSFKSKNFSGGYCNDIGNQVELDSVFEYRIKNDSNIEKKVIVNRWVNDNYYKGKVNSTKDLDLEKKQNKIKEAEVNFIIPSFSEKINIKAKGKSTFINLILALNSYIMVLMYFFIFLTAVGIFKKLSNGLTFFEKLHKGVKNIGIIILISQFAYFLLGLIYPQLFGNIHLETFPNELTGLHYLNIYFYPSHNFDWWFLILGFGLIIISNLFKYGFTLQKENELTI